MVEQMRYKTFQQLASVLCDMYEAVYEGDMYKERMYIWKKRDRGMLFPGIQIVYDQYIQEISAEYVHPDYREEYMRWMARASVIADFSEENRERKWNVLLKSVDGAYRWNLIHMQCVDKSEHSMEVITYIKDIHEQQLAEIERQQKVLEALQLMWAVDSAYDMVVSANLTQNSYYMIGCEHFLNHSAPTSGRFDDLIEFGKATVPESHKEAFVNAFSREHLLKAHREGRRSVYLEHQQYSDDGEIHWISTHVMFTENPYNDDILEITVSRNIDKVKEAEEKNRKVLLDAMHLAEQANQAKTDFLSRMSHDIRTPMNVISGMTEVARMYLDDRDKVEECLGKIDTTSHYLLSLINDVLDLSKIERGKMSVESEPFDFQCMIEGIETIIRSQAEEKEQTFLLHVARSVRPYYIGDELRIRQILMNLLGNAHKYTQNGGQFSLTVDLMQSAEDVSRVCFRVEDNGEGIREDCLTEIFDPFYQTRRSDSRRGSGLGLAITQNLVHLMDGSIHVKSEVGKGSCFTVEIPLKHLAGEALADMEAKSEKQADTRWGMHDGQEEGDVHEWKTGKAENACEDPDFHGEKILLVEDHELNREITVTILESRNLIVDTAVDGQDGVDVFAASGQGEYAMILMDIQMPVMNGYEAAKAIRRLDREDAKTIPIYAMTADAFSGDVAKALASGMNGHLSKPVDFRKLTAVLKRHIGS